MLSCGKLGKPQPNGHAFREHPLYIVEKDSNGIYCAVFNEI